MSKCTASVCRDVFRRSSFFVNHPPRIVDNQVLMIYCTGSSQLSYCRIDESDALRRYQDHDERDHGRDLDASRQERDWQDQ